MYVYTYFIRLLQAASTPTSFVDLTLERDMSEAIRRSLQDEGCAVEVKQRCNIHNTIIDLHVYTFLHIVCSVKEVGTLRDVVLMLQQKNGMKFPSTVDEWDMTPRCDIDVRRSHVVVDAVRAAKKKRFDSTKLLRVCLMSDAVKYYVCVVGVWQH